MSKDGEQVATKRTWLKQTFYPGTLAFDLTRNHFVRILQAAEIGNDFRTLQQNNLVMTSDLPTEFRFEVALQVSASEEKETYENIFAGKCFIVYIIFYSLTILWSIYYSSTCNIFFDALLKNSTKAIPSQGENVFALGLWNSQISGHIFGKAIVYDPKFDTKADLI